MRIIKSKAIEDAVNGLCVKANIELRKDIFSALELARKNETNPSARRIMEIIIENALIARKKHIPICQDTGMVVVYLKIGQAVAIKGDIESAVKNGVRKAYRENYFRKSVVKDPLIRKNTHTNLPPVIYFKIVPGDKVDIRVVIKGFGCENAGRVKMFRPGDPVHLIEEFIVDAVRETGSRACPPMYIGVGMGGTLCKAVELSKEAIFRPVDGVSRERHIAKLEKSVLNKLNRLKIGPMGLGGKTTVLGVSILTYPTHIAGLPVAVNVSCHATRDGRKVI